VKVSETEKLAATEGIRSVAHAVNRVNPERMNQTRSTG
jgi:hypothetical protein